MTDRGTVNARLEPEIVLRLRGPASVEVDQSAVIDTGYTGSLTVSPDLVAKLGLPRQAGGRAILADGSVRRFDTYAAEVFWGGQWTGVVVSTVGNETLVGMSLLAGRGLWVEAISGGTVEVRPIQSQ